MAFAEAFHRRLDVWVRPWIRLGRRRFSSFQVCGYTGLTLAVLMAGSLLAARGLPLWMLPVLAATGAATFLALAMVTKVLVGEERLIYYHHEVAILAFSAIVVAALGQPVFPYLDTVVLGVGLFLACGRCGCLMVGCCHGRPHRWGVCYRREHAEAGFAPYLVGVRLFPIQAVEALWVLAVVAVGAAMVFRGAAAGEALTWYVVAYDVGRFSFELLRGDPGRPYYGGFSEAQWTSLLLMVAVVGGEWTGVLPYHLWHVAATAAVVGAMVFLALFRRLSPTPKHRLLHPRHVREVAQALERPGAEPGADVMPVDTSLGVRISGGHTGSTQHYTLSSSQGTLTREAAAALAELILKLAPRPGRAELVAGSPGVFHLVVPEAETPR